MNSVQQKTGKMVRDFIIDALAEFGQDDSISDNVQNVCEQAGKIDMAKVDTDLLLQDPKVKAAFKKFVEGCIGSFQHMEDEFGPNAEEGASD